MRLANFDQRFDNGVTLAIHIRSHTVISMAPTIGRYFSPSFVFARTDIDFAQELDAQDELHKASAEGAAQVDQRARIDTHRDELARRLEGTRAARARALERATTAKEDREGLLAQESGTREARQASRIELRVVQNEWEDARGEEARLSCRRAQKCGS